MGGKGKHVKGGKAHQKPTKSSFFQDTNLSDNSKLMGFDMSNAFGGMKLEGGAEKTNYGIDSNLEITFKKMTKKDPTTKLKALKEFIVQLQQLEITEKVIEIYGKLYIQLSMDVDNLVREASQSALLALISTDKIDSESAVMIKIFPNLLISMYDIHPVTASVAQSCFQKAFSSQDVGTILAACQEDVLDNFTKNLTVLTAQTICTQSYSPEECQAKFERVVIGSLKGYGMYVEKINKEKFEEFKEKNLELIGNEKFITLYKNKSPQIRSAYFETISNILQHKPSLLIHVKEKLAALVFKSIDESDPAISSHIWSCVLLIQMKIELWWTFINMKLFFEKLFMILRSCTNCSLIFPNLLPLVSHFKGVFIGNQLESFHSNLMKNLHHGLTSEEKNLRSELSSISTAYFEVLQFIIIQVANEANEDEGIKLCNRYMDDYMIATIFWCLNKKGSFPKKLIYQGIAKIIHFLGNNASNSVYVSINERFWTEIYKIIASSMESKDLKETSSAHVEFIKNLSAPSKKQVRMKSDDSCDIEKPANSKSLEALVQKVCQVYIEKINVTMDGSLVKSLENFIRDYQSSDMIDYLKNENQCELFDIFEKWLKDEDIQHESVIEIIAILFKYLEDESKAKIISSWSEMTTEQKNFFIYKALECPLREDECIVEFLRSTASSHIVEIAKILKSEDIKILRRCFQKNKEIFPISDETCRNVVICINLNMAKALKDNNMSMFTKCATFLTEIFPIISMSADKKHIQIKIFLSLYESSLNEVLQDENLIWRMIMTCQEALSSGSLKIDKTLMNICLDIAREKMENLNELTAHRLEFISLIVSTILTNAFENEKNLFNSIKSDFQKLENLAFHIEVLRGKIYPQKLLEIQEDVDFQKVLNDTVKFDIFMANVILMMTTSDLRDLMEKSAALTSERTNFADDEDSESETEVEMEIYAKLYTRLIHEIEKGSENQWPLLMDLFLNILKNFSILNVFLKNETTLNIKQKEWISYLEERLKKIFASMKEEKVLEIKDAAKELPSILLSTVKYSGNIKSLLDDTINASTELSMTQLKAYESFSELSEKKILPLELLEKQSSDIAINVALMRLLIKNHLEGANFNETDDVRIIKFSLNLLDEIITKNKATSFLLYKRDLNAEKTEDVLFITSIMNFLSEILVAFPAKLNESQWDFVRLALSNWTLTLKKSCEQITDVKVQAFVVSIFKLNGALLSFIMQEKVKSSSQLIASVIDEWQAIFSTDVNTILLQIFMEIVKNFDNSFEYQKIFIDILSHHIEIDFTGVLRLRSNLISLNNCLEFSIENLKNKNVSICIVAAKFIKQLIGDVLKSDNEILVQNNSKYGDDDVVASDWHKLEMFKSTLLNCQEVLEKHVDISSLRFSEANDVSTIPSDIALTYLLSWNCILTICSESPLELRSVYINWISVNKFHEIFLSSIFEMIPRAIIKSPDICLQLGFSSFSPIEPNYEEVSIERFASFLYSKALRVIPVLVRKWWHGTDSKIAHLIDKITVNYVSPTLCTEELTALINKKEKDGNMNIRVLMNSREVIATYNIESAKMELQLKLANNHPLGVIKVESKKHLGGKLQGWEIVKQLSIYLSHQNGRLCDGIAIWKRNLDKKYEGVEECFICYSVVQLENLQLPKITCKACKKKFHSSCLYRWFSSSNKSTCPLCRSDF